MARAGVFSSEISAYRRQFAFAENLNGTPSYYGGISNISQVGRPWLFGIGINRNYLYGKMMFKDDPVQIEKILDNIKKSGN